jgi:regulator of sigma E protease
MVLVNILVFLVSLSLVIILHELGHFFMARRAGILCHEFSIGMGPLVWSKRKNETLYSIRLIPIGGYVMMSGEEIDDEIVKVGAKVRLRFDGNKVDKIYLDHEDSKYEEFELVTVEKVDLKGPNMSRLYINEYEVKRNAFYVLGKKEYQIAPEERNFNGKTVWQRFLAIFSGPAMNFILAFFVFLLVNLIVGFPSDNAVLGSVGESYPAGGVLEVGDEIISVEGTDVSSWEELSTLLEKDLSDREIDITVLRDGEELDVVVTPIIYIYSIGFRSATDSINNVIVGPVTESTIADNAGLEEGDEILRIGEADIQDWRDVVSEIEYIGAEDYEEGKIVTMLVSRDGEEIELSFEEPYTTAFLETQNINIVETRIGIGPEYSFGFFSSITGSIQNVGDSSMMIFTTIGLLFDNDGAGAGIGVDNLAGPLGIYEITSQALSNGMISLLSWVGLLSVNLGIINLLPIPALDGGRIVFLGYEAATRRKPNRRVENTLNYVMYLALMGLFVFITFNDLLRMFNIK